MGLPKEEIERRSKRAKEQVEKGEIGGAGRGQGRKKKITANEMAAIEAAKHSTKITDAILEALKYGKPGEKLKAAAMWLDIEAREIDRRNRYEQSRLENASKDELIKFVVEKMAELQEKNISVPNFDLDVKAVEEESGK